MEVAVGLLEVKAGKEKEIQEQAYEEGWERGIEQATELYEVSYPCCGCGKEIVVDTDEGKKSKNLCFDVTF